MPSFFKCKIHGPNTLFFHMCAPYLVSEEYIHTWRYPSAFLVLRRVLLLLGFGLGPFWWIFLIFIFACRNQLPRWLPHFHVVSMLDQLDQLPSTPTFHGICFAPFHVVLFDARHVYLQYRHFVEVVKCFSLGCFHWIDHFLHFNFNSFSDVQPCQCLSFTGGSGQRHRWSRTEWYRTMFKC